MPAEILEFEKPDEWYIRRSAMWSRRGELSKSLLYAYMTKKDSREARLCKATALYESGNLSPALRMLLPLRAAGDRGGDMYALIVKVLHDMTRFVSAAYFMREAIACGAFPFADGMNEPDDRSSYLRMYNEIRGAYPDNKFASDAPSLLYVLEHTRFGTDESLAAEMLFDDHDFAGSEIMFKATGVLTSDKLVPPLAYKLIETCHGALSDSGDIPRPDVMSALAVALHAAGEEDEARKTAELLAEQELPDDDTDLIKVIAALLSLDMGDEARYFLDELCAIQPTPLVLTIAAEAEINSGDRDAARDRLARCLTVDPDNTVAKYLLKKTASKRMGKAEYSPDLPNKVARGMYGRVAELIATGRQDDDPASTNETVRYILSRGNISAAVYLAEDGPASSVAEEVFLDYLTDIEGLPSLKRTILYNMFMKKKNDIPLYSFGYVTARAGAHIRGVTETELAAYRYALATYYVYCKEGADIDKVWEDCVGAFRALDISPSDSRTGAAVILALCNADLKCAGMDRSVLYVGSDEKEAGRIVGEVKKYFARKSGGKK